MMDFGKSNELEKLLHSKSKHFHYQLLHPMLSELTSFNSDVVGKYEKERQNFFENNLIYNNRKVLDIGANTGYFGYASILNNAAEVICQEGNLAHAKFIEITSAALKLNNKIKVKPSYFDFFGNDNETYDIVYCLNVLHHLGDDFGDKKLNINEAKLQILKALNNLHKKTEYLWLQIGYNWKGNKSLPLFDNGSKKEIIDFISTGTSECWDIEKIAVFDPVSKKYVEVSEKNLVKFESIGEFLNRPIFKLKTRNV